MSRLPYEMTSEMHEVVRLVTANLEAYASYGTLTVETLDHAVRCTYEMNGELRSVGIEFIWRNLRSFCAVVSPSQRLAFFRNHLGNPDVVRAISEANILDCIPERDRGMLIVLIAEHQPLRTIKWITAAMDCGVRPSSVAKGVLKQFQSPEILMDDKRTFARHLLSFGAGWVSESHQFVDYDRKPLFEAMSHRAHWHFLPADQLFEIIKEAVVWAPELMFTASELGKPNLQEQFLAIRPGYDPDVYSFGIPGDKVPASFFDRVQVTKLRSMAAAHLTSLKGLSVDMLMELPEDTWLWIAKQAMPGSLEFLVRVSLHSIAAQFCFANHFAAVKVTGDELLQTYRRLYFELHDTKVGERVEAIMIAIDKQLIKLLAKHGYYVGKVRRERSDKFGTQTVVYASHDADNGTLQPLFINGRPAKLLQSRGQRVLFDDDTIVYADSNTDPNLANRLNDKRFVVFGHLHHVHPEMGNNKI